MKIPKHHEQASSHAVPGKLDCVPISLPNLGEEPSPECHGTVHHLDSTGNGDCSPPGMQLGIAEYLDSIGNATRDCTQGLSVQCHELDSMVLVGLF